MFASTYDERVGVETGTLPDEPIVWAHGISLKCVGLGRDPRVRGDGRLGPFIGEIWADIPSVRTLDLWSTDGKTRDTIREGDLWDTGAPLYNIRKRGDVTVRLRLACERGLPVFCMQQDVRGFTLHVRLKPLHGDTVQRCHTHYMDEHSTPLAETMHGAMEQAMRIREIEEWEHAAILDNLLNFISISKYDLLLVGVECTSIA